MPKLPAQFQRHLELSRIKSRRRFACLSVQRIHVCDVKAVRYVENIQNPVEYNPLSKRNSPADPHVCKYCCRPGSRVAGEITGDGTVDEARSLQKSGRRVL